MRFAYDVSRLQLKAYNEIPDIMNNYISEYVQVSLLDQLIFFFFFTT